MKYAIMPALGALALAACNGAPGETAAPASALSKDVDALFAEFEGERPGCAAGVIEGGKYIHAKGYGMANLEYDEPITPDSVFRMGSISKQFTAAAIAILVARGDVQLDADVHAYLPELRDYGAPVTIRQMIHHLSGMGDYETDVNKFEVRPGQPFRWGNEDYWTIEEFYAEVAKQPLLHLPGEQFEYSNLAYFLLSQVVERASGKTLSAFAEAEIFAPLGMEESFFNDNVNQVVKKRVSGYLALEEGGYETFDTNLDIVGDGGVYTTLNDFLKWDQALANDALPESIAPAMKAPYPPAELDGWEPFSPGATYGYGLAIGDYEGEPVYSHTGGWVGFTTYYARFPNRDRSVVVFCNGTDAIGPVKGW
ncbi:MAG: beta-lactamase family protein, partial [Oricola sp.]|nr:beta-lactamase family protein [Oricola sp.]